MLIKSNILLDVRFEYVKMYFVDNIKYLGLILDKDLTFSLHIKRLKGRISRIADFFRRLRDILSFPVKSMLFFAGKPLVSDFGSLFYKWHTEGAK
jgi:hypothetical protein